MKKKQRFLFTLLMAIVMMVVSPTIMWAVSMGDDDDPPMDEPMEEPMPEPEPDPDPGYEEPQPEPEPEPEPTGCEAGMHSGGTYMSNGNGGHDETCGGCGILMSTDACTYNSKGYCTVCGYHCEGYDVTVTIDGYSTPYDGIQQALAAAKAASSATLTLLQDVTVQGTSLSFNAGNVTLDLNDCSVSVEYATTINVNGGSLTIVDSGNEKSGRVTCDYGSAISATSGSLTIHAGTFSSSVTYALEVNATEGNLTASIDGGRFISTSPYYSGVYTNGISALAPGYAYFSGETQISDTNSGALSNRGPVPDVTVKAAPAAPEVPTFASIQALLDANLASGTVVTVTVNGTIADTMYGPGVYQVVLDNGFAIASKGVTSNPGWAAGSTVSGTLENVTFMRAGEGDEEVAVISEDRNIFEDLTYAVPTFASIAELIAANQSYDAVNVTVNGMITMLYPEEGYDGVVLNNEILISAPATGITWKENGTVSGTLTNMRWDNDFRSLVGGSEEVWSSLTYTAPAPVATVTINGMEFQYTSIYQAIGALYETKTSTLKLLADVEYPTFNLEEGQDITIDLNDHKYTTQLYEDEWYSFEVSGDSKLTVKNGTIISNRGAFIVTENSSLNIFNCTVEAKRDGIRVNNEESFVNIVNTNISSETCGAIYMANGEVNLSGNCRFIPGSDWAPVFVDRNYNGVINLDFGYMMVDSDGTKITSFEENIGTRGQYAKVVADPAAVAECAAGSHSMIYHDAVPGTCTEHGKAEYWHCTTCQRFYADAAGNTILPLGSLDIIPETPFAHHFVDGRCTVCHMVELAEPVMVTESNYASLGLDEKYVGYYAIQNPSNLAFVAELFGGQLEPASEPETGVGGNDGPFCAPRRANKENGNDQQQKARRNAVRKAPSTQENILGFVLTDNIVVNANLLDANGMPNDRDNNGNIRSGLLAWTPMYLYNNADKTIFDGNGHTISGLYQNTPVRYSLGFIKATNEGVTIKNLGITDSYFGSIMEDYGGACGSLIDYSYADIENCWSDATIDVQNADYASIGGLVGFLEAGNISDSYFSGRIMSSGAREVAGLIAEIDFYSDDVTISNCHFSGTMSCKQGNIEYCKVAGLINYISANNGNLMIIERCYADGEIDAKGSNTIVSGLFNNQYTDGGTVIVRNNYNAMTVNAPSYYGLFYSAQGNGNISFNVNADKNASSPYDNAYISGGRNVSVADEENVYDGGFVFDVTEEQMASGAVAYMLNEWNKDIDPTEGGTPGETPGETPDVTPGETPGTEERPFDGPGEVPTIDPTDGGAFIEPGMDDPMCVAPRRAAAEETAPVWYQLIGEDAHPVLAGDEYSIVYCDDEEPTLASVFYNLTRTLETYDFVDATEYTFKSKTNVAELTYTRTFVGTNWTTWYVPFDLVLTDEICEKLAFSRINNVHQYDDDEDGNADRTVIESFRQKAGVTLKANYPYLVKALDESALSFEINLSDVELAPAKGNSIDCQSVDYTYTFTGTYTGMGESGLSSYSLFDDEEDNSWLHFHSLEPQRHYMTIISRNGGNGAGPAHVKLMVIGDEDADGIVTLYTKEQLNSATYDLMGRKINSNSKQPGLRIVNGKKVLFK